MTFHQNKQLPTAIIIDDHKIFAESLSHALKNINIVDIKGVGASARDCITLLQMYKPDIIFIDYDLKDSFATEIITEIKSFSQKTSIFILTMHTDPKIIKKIFSQPIAALFHKSESLEILVKALTRVIQGEEYASGVIASLLLKASKIKDVPIQLSDREREVLILLAKDYSIKEIALQLNLSSNTVDTYRKRLLEKTGAKGLAGLVNFAHKLAYVN